MTDVGELRQRRMEERNKKGNGTVYQQERDRLHDPEFCPRESPLTVLLSSSPHIRAIYHIFIAILIMLLFDTLIYDLIEHGKINLGISNIVHGFGDVRRCAKLWLFEFGLALFVYPALLLYAAGAKMLRKQPGALRIWSRMCAAGLATLLAALMVVPVWALASVHLALASSSIVTLEMVACRNYYVRSNSALDLFAAISWIGAAMYGEAYVRIEPLTFTSSCWEQSNLELTRVSGDTTIKVAIRFGMKIYSMIAACAPRCWGAKSAPPLPSFGHYVYFLFAPTLLYRDKYPRYNVPLVPF